MTAIALNFEPVLHLSDEVFEQLCQANRDAKLERSARGELIVMPPTGGETGDRNDEISFQLRAWNKQTRLGKTFNADTGFRLLNGATRWSPTGLRPSPDASWLSLERWEALTPDQRQKFPPLCPDFVVELRSPSDSLSVVQAKMQEYLDNGASLGRLIDPQSRRVEVYRSGQAIEIIEAPASLSGEDVLPGFVLELSEIL